MRNKKTLWIVVGVMAVLLVGASLFQTWRVSSELKQQKTQAEQQIALLLLSQKVPGGTLEGFMQITKIYVYQISVPGSSSHLYAYIAGKIFDLGEGQITQASNNQTGVK